MMMRIRTLFLDDHDDDDFLGHDDVFWDFFLLQHVRTVFLQIFHNLSDNPGKISNFLEKLKK